MLSVSPTRSPVALHRLEPLERRLALSADLIPGGLDVLGPGESSATSPAQPPAYYMDDPVTVTGTWAGSFAHNAAGDRTRISIRIGEPDPDGRFTARVEMRRAGEAVETVVSAAGVANADGTFWLAWETTRTNSGRIEGVRKPYQTTIDAHLTAVIGVERFDTDLMLTERIGTGEIYQPATPIEPNGGETGGVLGQLPAEPVQS